MKSRGYTLIEMAVTLLIVSLVMVSVLVAESLLRSARVRAFARETDALAIAVQLYRSRYGALPGDDATAGARWPGVANGNGDGLLGGRYDRPAPADVAALGDGNDDSESLLVWWHLRRAGFLTGATDGAASAVPPLSAVRQPLGIQSDLLGLPGTVACISAADGATAEAIDHAMDDGAPLTGWVRAKSADGASTAYAHDATYQLCASLEGRTGPALLVVGSDGNAGANDSRRAE